MRGDRAVLDLDEVTDVDIFAERGARPQARVRPDLRGGADRGVVDMGERLDIGARAHGGVDQHAVRADAHAVSQLDAAFEHATHIDRDIAAANEFAAHIDAGRIHQGHAAFQQCVGNIQLVTALELGQLHLAVHARHFPFAGRLARDDRHAVGHGLGDDVGEVVLALGIVVGQRRQPLLEVAGRNRHDAAVDFLDGAFGLGRVFLFDDAHDLAVFTHDAAQPEWIGLLDGENAQLVATSGLDQAAQRGDGGQRHVAVQHDRRLVVVQLRHGLHDGVTGALLRFLQRGIDRAAGGFCHCCDHLWHRCASMSINHA